MMRPLAGLALAGLAVQMLAPRTAEAHASEFLFAKVTLLQDGDCELTLTADYGDNPMIPSEEEARRIIADLVQVRSGDRVTRFSGLGPPVFLKPTALDPTTPCFQSAPDPGSKSELISGSWRWRPEEPSFTLEIPRDQSHGILLWTVNENQAPEPQNRWVMLLSGDESPLITLPERRTMPFSWLWLTAALSANAVILGMAFVTRHS